MNAKQIRQALMNAFGVKTAKELKKHLTKTDLRSKAEMLHAASVVWNYSNFYQVQNRGLLQQILKSQPESVQHQLALAAK